MLTTFNNVTITIEAESPEQAYDELCMRLRPKLGEQGTARGPEMVSYSTDTYVADHRKDGDLIDRDTEELVRKPKD